MMADEDTKDQHYFFGEEIAEKATVPKKCCFRVLLNAFSLYIEN
jgi:hypothetical protein